MLESPENTVFVLCRKRLSVRFQLLYFQVARRTLKINMSDTNYLMIRPTMKTEDRVGSKFEIKLTIDGRLLIIQRFSEGSNFWVHPDGTYTYCPTEQDIETLRMLYEAIDTYNKEQIFKRNARE